MRYEKGEGANALVPQGSLKNKDKINLKMMEKIG